MMQIISISPDIFQFNISFVSGGWSGQNIYYGNPWVQTNIWSDSFNERAFFHTCIIVYC